MKSTNQHGVLTASTDEDENIQDIAIDTIEMETEQDTAAAIVLDNNASCNKLEQKSEDIVLRLKGNGQSQREKHWINIELAFLKEKLLTADSVYKCFYTNETIMLIQILSDGKEVVKKSDRKYLLVNKLCKLLNITGMKNPQKRRQVNPMSLRNLCKRTISSKVSKDFLNIVFATNMMPVQLDKFQRDGIFTNDIKVQGLFPTTENGRWSYHISNTR